MNSKNEKFTQKNAIFKPDKQQLRKNFPKNIATSQLEEQQLMAKFPKKIAHIGRKCVAGKYFWSGEDVCKVISNFPNVFCLTRHNH